MRLPHTFQFNTLSTEGLSMQLSLCFLVSDLTITPPLRLLQPPKSGRNWFSPTYFINGAKVTLTARTRPYVQSALCLYLCPFQGTWRTVFSVSTGGVRSPVWALLREDMCPGEYPGASVWAFVSGMYLSHWMLLSPFTQPHSASSSFLDHSYQLDRGTQGIPTTLIRKKKIKLRKPSRTSPNNIVLIAYPCR